MGNTGKCYTCKAKLSLVDATIGGCKCGQVYCNKHRMPETHACTHNHREVVGPPPEPIVAPKMVKI